MRALAWFEARVEKDEATGCWNWKLARDRDGYGLYGRKTGGSGRAHRGAWEAVSGPIAKGLSACHRCDNPSCINPAHLFLGTQADNIRDKVEKGRTAKGSSNGAAKFSEHDVSIIKMLLELGVRQCRLVSLYGVSRSIICDISRGRRWVYVAPMEVQP
jgi:hypothetical protein